MLDCYVQGSPARRTNPNLDKLSWEILHLPKDELAEPLNILLWPGNESGSPFPLSSTYLHHSDEGFRVFLEHILEGTGWKPQYCGWSGCSSWDSFIGSRVTLRENSRHTGLIHQLSNLILPKFLFCCCLCADRTQKKPWTGAPWPRGWIHTCIRDRGREITTPGSWMRLRSSDTVLLQSQPSGGFEIPASPGCREKKVCWFYYLYWQPSYLLQKQPQTHTNSEKHNKIEQ